MTMRTFYNARFISFQLVCIKFNAPVAVFTGNGNVAWFGWISWRIHGRTFRSGMTFFAASGGNTTNHFCAPAFVADPL